MRRIRMALCALAFLFALAQTNLGRPRVTFAADRAYALIKSLSSPEYEGRRCGTEGDQAAQDLISGRFKEAKLAFLPGEESYRQSFSTFVPVLKRTPILEVLNQAGQIVRRYRHREDFREITAGASGSGDLTGRFAAAASSRSIAAGGSGLILLADEAYQVDEDYGLLSSGVKALIVRNPEESVRRKSLSLLGRGSGGRTMAKAFATPRVMRELSDYSRKGMRIHLRIDLSIDRVHTANLLGMLPGTETSVRHGSVLVLSSHLDHIGRDPSGTIFPGALDNASGVAVMTSIFESLSGLSFRPKKTIVFVAFNAEECTLGGSSFFVGHWPFYPGIAAQDLNLDMLGAKEVRTLTCLVAPEAAGGKAEKSILERLRVLAAANGLPFAIKPYASADHMSFLPAGIPAVTLINFAEVHRKTDDINNISLPTLKAVGQVALDYVMAEAY